MKHLLIILILILILVGASGCAEYLHKPDEISLGASISETNLGNSPFIQGKPVTTGVFGWMTWYRRDE